MSAVSGKRNFGKFLLRFLNSLIQGFKGDHPTCHFKVSIGSFSDLSSQPPNTSEQTNIQESSKGSVLHWVG